MESLTVQRRFRVSAEERAQWVSQYHSSGLSTRQFAQQHGLKDGTLQRWVREERQRSPSASEAAGFQEVQVSCKRQRKHSCVWLLRAEPLGSPGSWGEGG